jgi:transcriptional regulator with XRE-family HTH domain
MDVRRLVGQNLRRLRLEKGWSQEELAFRSDLDRTYVSGVERGVRNPTIIVLSQLGHALGVDEAAFLERRRSAR